MRSGENKKLNINERGKGQKSPLTGSHKESTPNAPFLSQGVFMDGTVNTDEAIHRDLAEYYRRRQRESEEDYEHTCIWCGYETNDGREGGYVSYELNDGIATDWVCGHCQTQEGV